MTRKVKCTDVLKIRLAREGQRHHPSYRINVALAGWRRDGRHIENLGKYEPIPDAQDGMKHIQLNFERVKYWLAKGAQPSPRVAWLLGKVTSCIFVSPIILYLSFLYS